VIAERRIPRIEDYEPLIGREAVERIKGKARGLEGLHVTNINSTYYGGGVAEILSSLTLLMNTLGIKAGWRAIQGSPDFFSITKKMHNALQGGDIKLTDMKKRIYEDVVGENAVRNHLDHDFVVVHDPQPLPLITHYKKKGPWIWRAHIDLSGPHAGLMDYLSGFIEMYDAVILTLPEYRLKLRTPQVFQLPAIDPFIIKNAPLGDEDIEERLKYYGIPTDLPLVVQISRFDRWKDPEGVIKAFKRARKEVKATLVLLGDIATDDPEGEKVYHSLLGEREERIKILTREDTALVNALQSKAAVVMQKSVREGFGLTVTEAMWKGTPVVGGNVGGIKYQIEDGVNGFLVSSVDEAADRLVQLLRDEEMRREMGRKARESVKKNFLMSRLAENYLDLFGSFETIYELKERPWRDGRLPLEVKSRTVKKRAGRAKGRRASGARRKSGGKRK
jgi:trehalose synthase